MSSWVNWLLAFSFFLFALAQLNDPDPWAWAAYYGFVGLMAAFAARGRRRPYLLLAGLGVSLIWLVTLAPDFIRWVQMGMPTIVDSMKAEAPHIELTREFFGLVLGGLALGYLLGKKR